jgi:hypothetical protein
MERSLVMIELMEDANGTGLLEIHGVPRGERMDSLRFVLIIFLQSNCLMELV